MSACVEDFPASRRHSEIQPEPSASFGCMAGSAREYAGNRTVSFRIEFGREFHPLDLLAKGNNLTNDNNGRRFDRIGSIQNIGQSSGAAILNEVGPSGDDGDWSCEAAAGGEKLRDD